MLKRIVLAAVLAVAPVGAGADDRPAQLKARTDGLLSMVYNAYAFVKCGKRPVSWAEQVLANVAFVVTGLSHELWPEGDVGGAAALERALAALETAKTLGGQVPPRVWCAERAYDKLLPSMDRFGKL